MYYKIDEALEVLMSRKNQTYGIDLFKSCLDSLGNPQRKLNCVHIGGTNGKGSTTNFTRSLLQHHNLRVGTFTSPHLVTHNDRIRINNEPISDSDLLMYINITEPLWEVYQLSMFEIDMLISILYFIDECVDCVIYEVGLGGRLDATNVIEPQVIGITNVDYDHMNILGDTLEKIAYEKAGIIKQGIPFFTTADRPEVCAVFDEVADDRGVTVHYLRPPSFTKQGKEISFTVDGYPISLKNHGVYQVTNSLLAIRLAQTIYPKLNLEKCSDILSETYWAGRFEEVLPQVYVDGAHNEMGIRALIRSMEGLPRPWIVVFTALRDKHYATMIDLLESTFDQVIITEFEFYRSETAEALALGHHVVIIKDYRKALDSVLENSQSGTSVVTGSLYFISEARKYLKNQ